MSEQKGSSDTAYAEHELFADETDRYLDKHGIYDLFAGLLQSLVINRPSDPLSLLLAELEQPVSQTHVILDGVSRSTRNYVAAELAKTGLVHINVPALLQEEMKGTTGQKFIQTYVEKRELPPLDLIIPLIKLRLRMDDCRLKGWVMTDFPNTEEEALALHQAGLLTSHYIYIEAGAEAVDAHLAEVAAKFADEKQPLLCSSQMPVSQLAYTNNKRLLAKFFQGVTSIVTASSTQQQQVFEQVQAIVTRPAVSQAPCRPKKICILGMRGSGKATQAKMLARKYGLVHVSMESLMRAEREADSGAWRRAAQFVHEGLLVPDDVVCECVANRLAQNDCKTQGWVLDGIPKTEGQAAGLTKLGICPSRVVSLEVDRAIADARVEHLRVHPATGHVYKVTDAGIPAAVLRALVQRQKDTKEVRDRNNDSVSMNLLALNKFYNDYIKMIDANQEPTAVFEQLDTFLLAPLNRR